MKEFKELIRVLFAIFRYPAAVVVAFMASMATVIYLPGLFQSDDSDRWFFCMGLAREPFVCRAISGGVGLCVSYFWALAFRSLSFVQFPTTIREGPIFSHWYH
jgi:hypothetical protein